MNKTWLQITSGRGPAECQWVVAKLTHYIVTECFRTGIKMDVLETVQGDKRGTYKSSLLSLSGNNVEICLLRFKGTVLWHGQSPFRPHHKRKNWYVGVEALLLSDKADASNLLPQLEKEIRIETLRASGPGGQSVNKRESAIRITHLPSGISVVGREERSQLMNRRLALARLQSYLLSELHNEQAADGFKRWQQHERLQRGNPVLQFKGRSFREY